MSTFPLSICKLHQTDSALYLFKSSQLLDTKALLMYNTTPPPRPGLTECLSFLYTVNPFKFISSFETFSCNHVSAIPIICKLHSAACIYKSSVLRLFIRHRALTNKQFTLF